MGAPKHISEVPARWPGPVTEVSMLAVDSEGNHHYHSEPFEGSVNNQVNPLRGYRIREFAEKHFEKVGLEGFLILGTTEFISWKARELFFHPVKDVKEDS